MDVVNLGASIASLTLAVWAMLLSIFFYTQSKNTEARVNCALEAIKAQTDALQRLTGRWMDRLTKYVTTPRDSDASQQQLLIAIKDLPRDIVSQLHVPNKGQPPEDLLGQIVSAYCALYYYTAVANYWAQLALPPLDEYNQNPEFANFVKQAVDETAKDFCVMANTLSQIDQGLIEKSPTKYLADKARAQYRDLIADSTQVYAKRAQTSSGS